MHHGSILVLIAAVAVGCTQGAFAFAPGASLRVQAMVGQRRSVLTPGPFVCLILGRSTLLSSKAIQGGINRRALVIPIFCICRMVSSSGVRDKKVFENRMTQEQIVWQMMEAATAGGEADRGCSRALETLAVPMLVQFSTLQMATTINLYGKYLREAQGQAMLEALIQRACCVMNDFEAEELSKMTWAFGRSLLRLSPGNAFVKGIGKQIHRKIGDFEPQILTNILEAYATLGVQPGACGVRLLEGQITTRIGDFTALALANVMRAAAALGLKPPDTLPFFEGQIKARISDFSRVKELEESQCHQPQFTRMNDDVSGLLQGRDTSFEHGGQAWSEPASFHIIGAGPVGLASALLLAQQGHQSIVYEGRHAIVHVPEESYPIGVNSRGRYTLEMIDPELKVQVEEAGIMVDSWQIFGGPMKVAQQDSGVVLGTSRGSVTDGLLKAAEKSPLIKIVYNMRVRDVRVSQRQVVFEERQKDGSKKEVVIDCGAKGRVLACDGVNSGVRTALTKLPASEGGITAVVEPWKTEFRVLFAPAGAGSPLLDEKVHYIFSGCYVATVGSKPKKAGQEASSHDMRWTCVMSAKDSDSQVTRDLILATEATPERVAALRKMVKKLAPKIEPIIMDEEIAKYFTRRSFRGAVVKCSRMHCGEFVVLLGDAAHSVLPPVGEGINSALEDAMILAQCFAKSPERAFAAFQEAREKDIEALTYYARYLNEQFDVNVPGEGGARLLFQILEGAIYKTTAADNLFGALSTERNSYESILTKWKTRKNTILPMTRAFTYPFAWTAALVASPITLTMMAARKARGMKASKISNDLKPPVPE